MSSELEDLIRRILVKNPAQRYSLNQIKGHPWLQQCPRHMRQDFAAENMKATSLKCVNGELNPQVLHLMHSLSIDISKTKKVNIYIQILRYYL